MALLSDDVDQHGANGLCRADLCGHTQTHKQTMGAVQAGKAWTTVVCPDQRLFFFGMYTLFRSGAWSTTVHIANIKENDGDHRM